MASQVVIVVPCYNEEARLDSAQFRAYDGRSRHVRFCFVNDGSRDGTLRLLERLCLEARGEHFILNLPTNLGKGEAVRQGLLAAMETNAALVGFWDADLATPLAELDDFMATLAERPEVEVVIGSRVKLLGRSIERSASRHYLGRVFATGASMALGLAVYDTQCGAKLFRVTPALKAVLAEPFCTRWVFDVEILARYQRHSGGDGSSIERRVYELPLKRWTDVPGSKVRPWDFVRSGIELMKIWNTYRRGLRS